jgi:hypothetical protein
MQCRSLFDHLVRGGEKCGGDGHTERPCSLEIYRQLGFCDLLYRQISRLLTFQDTRCMEATDAIPKLNGLRYSALFQSQENGYDCRRATRLTAKTTRSAALFAVFRCQRVDCE